MDARARARRKELRKRKPKERRLRGFGRAFFLLRLLSGRRRRIASRAHTHSLTQHPRGSPTAGAGLGLGHVSAQLPAHHPSGAISRPRAQSRSRFWARINRRGCPNAFAWLSGFGVDRVALKSTEWVACVRCCLKKDRPTSCPADLSGKLGRVCGVLVGALTLVHCS